MDVAFSEARPDDKDALADLLIELRLGIARLSHPYAVRIFMRDAARSPYLHCLVARSGQRIVGAVILATDWARYRKTLILRHPTLIPLYIAKWLRSRRAAHAPAPARPQHEPIEVETAPIPGHHWRSEGPGIARVLEVMVHPEARGQGLSKRLYEYMFTYWKERGKDYIYSTIIYDNTPSIRLHVSTGFQMDRYKRGYFAVKRL